MKIIGVVLAGGLSSRMQMDKTKLFWKGHNLLEHTSMLLSKAGCAAVLVSNNSSDQYIKDRYPQAGPLAGIDACLDYICNHFKDADAMLIMPVDMPLMNRTTLENLITQARYGSAVYYTAGRFPLILPVNKTISELLTDRLDNNSGKGVSIKNLLSDLKCQVLEIDKEQQSAFFNCNTPEQWQNLISK